MNDITFFTYNDFISSHEIIINVIEALKIVKLNIITVTLTP
jgi:hypothetical protein